MPLKNGMPYLKSSVDSILNQTESNFKFLIVDDHSTDSSIEYLKSINDPRIEILQNEGDGIADALNTGLQKTNSEYVAIMDSDDISILTRLEEQKKFLDSNPDCALVGSSIIYIGKSSKRKWKLKLPDNDKRIITDLRKGRFALAHSTVMMRTKLIKEINGYSNVDYPNIDTNMYLRMSGKGQLMNLSEIYNYVRLHEFSYTQVNLEKIARQNYLRDKKNIFSSSYVYPFYLSQKFYKRGLMLYLDDSKIVWLLWLLLSALLYPKRAINYIRKKI